MVQQAAPIVAVRTLEGQVLARTCDSTGCVWSQVNVHLRIDSDDSWVIACHDASDPLRNAQVAGDGPCERQVLGQMLDAIVGLAPAQP